MFLTWYQRGWCFQQLPWPEQFCAFVALDVSAPGWVACEVLHTAAVIGDSSAEKELQEELTTTEERVWGGLSGSLAAVIRGSLLEGEADPWSVLLWSKRSHYTVEVDGFLSSPQQSPGQQMPQLKELLISWSHHLLSVPQIIVLIEISLKCNILRNILCMKYGHQI